MTVQDPAGSKVAAVRGKRWRQLVAVAVLMILAALAAFGLKVAIFVRTDQRFCAEGCHAPKDGAQVWHTRGHQEIACQSCHATPAGTGLGLWWKKTTGAKELPKHGKAKAAECTTCHERKPVEWRQVEATEGHRTHRGVKKLDCLSCHGENAHNTVAPSEKLCLKCHEPQRLHKATGDAETCLSCHSFAVSPRLAQKPTAMACVGCHADTTKVPQKLKDGALVDLKMIDDQSIHGGLDCKLCHDPHGVKHVIPEGQPVCARCHQFQLMTLGKDKAGPEGHKNCEGCHKPHAPRKHALDSCIKCHEKNATGIAASGGLSTAVKHKSCASCHLPHSWKAERSGCVTCHEDKAQLILTRSPPQHGACTNCHEVHGPPPTGLVCLNCHAKTKPNHLAMAPARHKDCTSCHNPHAPSPSDTRTSCAKCHLNQLSQVMKHGPDGHSKQGCFGCHKPHDNPLPPPNLCGTCHGDKAKLVATAGPPKHRVCTSCHEKHVFKITDPAVACSTCHKPIRAAIQSGGPHQGDCKSCHTLHGSPNVPKAACFKCHDKIEAGFKPPNEQHATCKSCHEPHTPAKTAPAKCGSCHEGKILIAARWPANSAHAKECNQCHTPHDVRTKKACADCHQKEAQSATGGKHQCQQCHPPHKPPPGTGKAWWSRCSECHAAKVESVKARGPKHSECNNCHQPHKFAVPQCSTCHNNMASKGLHAVPQHAANCNKCHDPHVKSEPKPAQCLDCHTNRKNHEPTAERCQGCHTFQ